MPATLVEGLKDRILSSVSIYQSIGIVIPGTNYTDMVRALFDCVREKPDAFWVYVAVTRPFESFVRIVGDINSYPNITFIDCISRAAGIVRYDDKCIYIESPTMLENVMMEIISLFSGIPEDKEKFLILDSTSALLIHNDEMLVTEFFYQLLSRLRYENIHMISLMVEEGEGDKGMHRLIYLNDKILRVRDSFL